MWVIHAFNIPKRCQTHLVCHTCRWVLSSQAYYIIPCTTCHSLFYTMNPSQTKPNAGLVLNFDFFAVMPYFEACLYRSSTPSQISNFQQALRLRSSISLLEKFSLSPCLHWGILVSMPMACRIQPFCTHYCITIWS